MYPIEFVDIAGLVRGAYRGEGLGNKFLSHIREVDAIVHVVRCFEDENIAEIQQRLMDLGYMDNDEPTNYYGPNTKEAVEIFPECVLQYGLYV